jgi:hypothetical protein
VLVNGVPALCSDTNIQSKHVALFILNIMCALTGGNIHLYVKTPVGGGGKCAALKIYRIHFYETHRTPACRFVSSRSWVPVFAQREAVVVLSFYRQIPCYCLQKES